MLSSRPVSLVRPRSWRERTLSALVVVIAGLLASRLTLGHTPFGGSVLVVWQLLPFVLLSASAFVITSRAGTIAGLVLLAAVTAAGNLTIDGSQTSSATAYVVLPIVLTLGALTWVLGDLAVSMTRGLRGHRSA